MKILVFALVVLLAPAVLLAGETPGASPSAQVTEEKKAEALLLVERLMARLCVEEFRGGWYNGNGWCLGEEDSPEIEIWVRQYFGMADGQ